MTNRAITKDAMMSNRSDWVERNFDITLNDFQKDCVDLICDAQGCGPYDFSSTFEKAKWQYGRGVLFTILPLRLATWDFNGLTKLVIGAHEKRIRVEIMPCNFGRIKVQMHPRKAEGGMAEMHPTIEEAIKHYRT
jgi:hypothetical protein